MSQGSQPAVLRGPFGIIKGLPNFLLYVVGVSTITICSSWVLYSSSPFAIWRFSEFIPSEVISSTPLSSLAKLAKMDTNSVQLIQAPHRPEIIGQKSIFLAGTTTPTDGPDWRETLAKAISDLPVTVTIFDPTRSDWDSSWEEDITFPKFKEQVDWELDMQEQADLVVFYFGPNTKAPISLLELGLAARSGKVIVGCHKKYEKRGNVQVIAERFHLELLEIEDDHDGLAAAVRKRINILQSG
ncbi:hypothetical protein QBC44DRAFT_336091 [Cladorrhinum sp. PSN332]|nr:hypothetical protein QBC44DRAFT_336091 [Cladorrhinum sp. PSN332]